MLVARSMFETIIHGKSTGKILLNHSIIPFLDALIQRVGFKTKAPVTNKNNNITNKNGHKKFISNYTAQRQYPPEFFESLYAN